MTAENVDKIAEALKGFSADEALKGLSAEQLEAIKKHLAETLANNGEFMKASAEDVARIAREYGTNILNGAEMSHDFLTGKFNDALKAAADTVKDSTETIKEAAKNLTILEGLKGFATTFQTNMGTVFKGDDSLKKVGGVAAGIVALALVGRGITNILGMTGARDEDGEKTTSWVRRAATGVAQVGAGVAGAGWAASELAKKATGKGGQTIP